MKSEFYNKGGSGKISTARQIEQNMPLRPFVTPHIHPRVQRVLQQKELLFSLMDGIGSPLNIMFPQNIDDNIKSFQAAFRRHVLRGRIYYTGKPCKSESLLRHASFSDVFLDVSSPKSLAKAMSCGFNPARIEATGPKNAEYILMCLQLDVLLNVDNMDELKMIEALHQKLGLTRKARIYVRLCGFSSSRISFTPQDNTFGIHVRDIPALLDWLVERNDIFDFQGYAFYISGAGNEQRLVAIENQLELTMLAIEKGLKPKGINIGGGFNVEYAASQEEWDQYQLALKRSVKGEIPSQTWNNSGLGYRMHNDTVLGAPAFFSHAHPISKGDELDELLEQRLPQFGNTKIADVIRDHLLELYIEPGRSMLDQCGMTLGRVSFHKNSTWGETLIGVDMNQTNLMSHQYKNLTQSTVLYRTPSQNQTNENGLYYIGNLCLAYDILQYNKQYPDLIPQAGDIICFMNTAPYAMDFGESETLMQPLAKKLALWEQDDRWKWALDEKYMPVDFMNLES